MQLLNESVACKISLNLDYLHCDETIRMFKQTKQEHALQMHFS